jgi:acetyl esterase/lipase
MKRLTMKHSALILTALFAVRAVAMASEPSVLAPSPTPSKIVEIYGFPVGEPNVKLKWSVYTPAGSGPWPAVLVIHEGGWKTGSRNDGDVVIAANDLANAGYLALAISYRLAPPGHLPGQQRYGDDGRYPKQSADVQMAIRAARTDPRCNGQVGAVGGSAGATHGAVAAGTGTIGDDRLDVAVCLSGAYNFSDFSGDLLGTLQHDATNYVGSSDLTVLLNDSPVSIIDSAISPIFLVGTVMDPMPIPQLDDMVAKLRELGVTNFSSSTLAGSKHAFDYWTQVRTPAIKFLAKGFAAASGASSFGRQVIPDFGRHFYAANANANRPK